MGEFCLEGLTRWAWAAGGGCVGVSLVLCCRFCAVLWFWKIALFIVFCERAPFNAVSGCALSKKNTQPDSLGCVLGHYALQFDMHKRR